MIIYYLVRIIKKMIDLEIIILNILLQNKKIYYLKIILIKCRKKFLFKMIKNNKILLKKLNRKIICQYPLI